MTERLDPQLERTARIAELVLGHLDDDDRAALLAAAASDSGLANEIDEARDTFAQLDALVALEEPSPAVPAPGLRDRILDIALPERRFEGFVHRVGRLFDLDEERARAVLSAIDAPGADWRDLGIPGALFFDLAGGPRVAAADCGLVSLSPGASIPRHVHRGDEWMLVLAGYAREQDGELLEPGDLIHRVPGTRHTIEAVGATPHVFAVVLEGGFHLDLPGDDAS